MLTEKGYTRRTYQDILDAKIQRAKELFGEDIDTSDLTPLGKFIRINAYDQAETEEEAEMIYYSISPHTAVGVSLDRLCVFVGISRNPATEAVYTVDVTGTAGEVVPLGFLVGTDSEIQYYNTAATEIGEDGTCTITVECTVSGTIGNVNSEDISVIVNPDAAVSGISNAKCVILGTDEESDVSLRQRFDAAREGSGSCNENSIRAALVRIETVTSASVIANTTDQVDEAGRPPHSFECYVACGGEQYYQQIADTIFDKKPIGIATYGKITQVVTDSSGTQHEIKFSQTENIDIHARVKITANAEFQGDTGKDEIAANLREYINTLGVGSTVYISSLYGKIHSVAGVVDVVELKLSTDGGQSYASENVEIAAFETASCTNVSVEVVG